MEFSVFDANEAWKSAADLYLSRCEFHNIALTEATVATYLKLRDAKTRDDVLATGEEVHTPHCIVCGHTNRTLLVCVESQYRRSHICSECVREMGYALDSHIDKRANGEAGKYQPNPGDEAECAACHKKIVYVGPYWDHVGPVKPRHPGFPAGHVPWQK